ncbi:hypothetical protein [Methylobacterium oryzisoli]|uniref:hypothetical protein n=1 Tax=Methylobacterium oryzisoli TaxID=3385502 RepID=UPI0038913530
MPLSGAAALAMWWQIEPAMRDEFQDWHSHEHFTERMNIPGFRRGSRWADRDGGEGFFVLYELESPATLVSPSYLERLNAPTPWSTKMMPHHRNMVRSQCRVVESFGGGIAQHMLTLRFSPEAEEGGAAWDGLRTVLAGMPDIPGLTGAHVLRTDTPAIAPTTEQLIRGGDAVADWVVLLSGYDEAATEAALTAARRALVSLSVDPASVVADRYRLSYSLSCHDLPCADHTA